MSHPSKQIHFPVRYPSLAVSVNWTGRVFSPLSRLVRVSCGGTGINKPPTSRIIKIGDRQLMTRSENMARTATPRYCPVL